MTDAPGRGGAASAAARDFRRLTALVVDDSAERRRALSLLLAGWNFDVLETAGGAAALELCRVREVEFVICDCAAPGMTAPALCRALRALPLAHNVYIIMLTARGDSRAVASGIEAGADDFLSTPPDPGELHARLRAGERMLSMQEDLADKNRRLTEAFDRLTALHDDVERNLRSAALLQRALAPPRSLRCGHAGIGTLWRPAGRLASELVGFFPVSPARMVAYAIDVPGAGVPSALMAARLAHVVAPSHGNESPAIRRLPTGAHAPGDPADLVGELNRRVQDEGEPGQPFTMLFADIDVSTGLVRFCQAGHPAPAVLRRDGGIQFHGQRGAPIGLLPDMVWETETVQLDPGERLVLLSDGITGCANAAGETFETAALAPLLAGTRHLPEAEQLDRLLAALAEFAGRQEFVDDVSALALTMP